MGIPFDLACCLDYIFNHLILRVETPSNAYGGQTPIKAEASGAIPRSAQ
jgi:hypothetical protein